MPTLCLAACMAASVGLAPGDADEPDLASASSGAVVTGPQNASGSRDRPMVANDGDVTDYGPNHGYVWGWFRDPLVVTFPEPRTINQVDVLLLDVDARAYDLRLGASVGGEWRELGHRESARGWVTLTFEPVDCSAIRLVFTGTTLATKSYHVVEVAAYHGSDPEADSPLKRQWLRSREQRQLGELRLLGVDEALEHVFLDAAMFERCKALPEGERRWIDTDGDGDPDLIVFMDQRALICAIDDDDDALADHPEPDEDSDCWVVDLDLDGRPDRVLDYWDDDGDGDVDRAHHYYLHHGWFGSRPGLVLIWDYNDNNRTWALDRYSYHQGSCQWKCDFGGDEGFCIFVHDPKEREWAAHWECPFYFYDPDQDGLAEVALRLEGHGRRMQALRYSMNADNDVTEGQPYDYDFAVVALGPVDLPEQSLVRARLRTGETGPYLPYDTARRVVKELPWTRACLVWDENDCNTDPADGARHERWEGVINSRYGEFPQIGGPSCGTVNKRYELDVDNSGHMRLYASPVDGRLHLLGAEQGTLWADDSEDGRPDRTVEYRDTDGDGLFDRWLFDDDADGRPERTLDVPLGEGATRTRPSEPVALVWAEVASLYRPLLEKTVAGHERVARALGVPLTESPNGANLEARRWALERQIHLAFRTRISAATTEGDERQARRLRQAQGYWEGGDYERAAVAPAPSAG